MGQQESQAQVFFVNFANMFVKLTQRLRTCYRRGMDQRQLYRRIGALVRETRKRNGLTQEALSQGVGMSRAALANIEAGRQQMLVHQLFAIARVLEVALPDLLPPPIEVAVDGNGMESQLPPGLSEMQRQQIMKLIKAAEEGDQG